MRSDGERRPNRRRQDQPQSQPRQFLPIRTRPPESHCPGRGHRTTILRLLHARARHCTQRTHIPASRFRPTRRGPAATGGAHVHPVQPAPTPTSPPTERTATSLAGAHTDKPGSSETYPHQRLPGPHRRPCVQQRPLRDPTAMSGCCRLPQWGMDASPGVPARRIPARMAVVRATPDWHRRHPPCPHAIPRPLGLASAPPGDPGATRPATTCHPPAPPCRRHAHRTPLRRCRGGHAAAFAAACAVAAAFAAAPLQPLHPARLPTPQRGECTPRQPTARCRWQPASAPKPIRQPTTPEVGQPGTAGDTTSLSQPGRLGACQQQGRVPAGPTCGGCCCPRHQHPAPQRSTQATKLLQLTALAEAGCRRSATFW